MCARRAGPKRAFKRANIQSPTGGVQCEVFFLLLIGAIFTFLLPGAGTSASALGMHGTTGYHARQPRAAVPWRL
jgi:hypothetical protein